MRYPRAFYFAQQIMNRYRENRPVDSKPRKEKRRRCIGVLLQEFNERNEWPDQDNLDGRKDCGDDRLQRSL